MATYAQFFIKSLQSGKPIEGCGDRAIIRLDGRMSRANQELLSERVCRERGFIAWQIIQGPHLLAAVPVTKVVPLYH